MTAGPRPIGAVNWVGVWTLYAKEVRRFLKVFTQTIAAPAVTTLLFLAIFTLARGRGDEMVSGVPFLEFLVPGLAMMSMVVNSFANTSSSLMISKVQKNIVDVLMPPITAGELTFCYAMGGVTRGVIVGVAVTLTMSIFVPVHIHHLPSILFHGVAGSLMLALLGIMGGIWADKFDHIAAVTNFAVTPFAFLSGTFYSIQRLPEFWNTLAHFNPFFYMIDGFRYGFIGHADGSLPVGLAVMVAVDTLLWIACYRMLATGYKLKA